MAGFSNGRNAAVLNLYLQCWTQEEIAESVGMSRTGIEKVLTRIPNYEIASIPGQFTEGQPADSAAVAVDLLPQLKVAAKDRQATSTGGKNPQLVAQMPQADTGKSRDQADKLVGVSPRYVFDAAKLKAESPEAFKAVKEGAKTVTEAKREHGGTAPGKKNTLGDDAQSVHPSVQQIMHGA